MSGHGYPAVQPDLYDVTKWIRPAFWPESQPLFMRLTVGANAKAYNSQAWRTG